MTEMEASELKKELEELKSLHAEATQRQKERAS